MIESVVTVLKERPCGTKLLVAGDLNVNLLDPEEYFGGGGGVVAALNTAGIEDMLEHFLLRQIPWCRDGRMWSMV